MRRFLLAVVLLVACGGSDSSSAPQTGTVKFTRDGVTCSAGGATAFDFFSDGVTLGTATLTAGGSQSYAVNAGSHAFSVKVSNSVLTFGPVTGVVSGGGTFTFLMTC